MNCITKFMVAAATAATTFFSAGAYPGDEVLYDIYMIGPFNKYSEFPKGRWGLPETSENHFIKTVYIPEGEFSFYFDLWGGIMVFGPRDRNNMSDTTPVNEEVVFDDNGDWWGYVGYAGTPSDRESVGQWKINDWPGGTVTIEFDYGQSLIDIHLDELGGENPYPADDPGYDEPDNPSTGDVNIIGEGPDENGVINIIWQNSNSLSPAGCVFYDIYLQNLTDKSQPEIGLPFDAYAEDATCTIKDTTIVINLSQVPLDPGSEYRLLVPEGYVDVYFNNWQSHALNDEITYDFVWEYVENPDTPPTESIEQLYTKECAGLSDFMGDPFYYEDNEFAAQVIREGDEVYILNPLSLSDFDIYVKGTISANGTITVPVPQTIGYDELKGCNIDLYVLKAEDYTDQYGRKSVTFKADYSRTSFRYVPDESGRLKLTLPGDPYDGENIPDYAIGYVYSKGGVWTNYADWYQVLTPIEGEIVKMPAGVETKTYSLIWDKYATSCEIGREENVMYIKGLNPNVPEGVFKATINGDKAYIEQNQIIGIFDYHFIYTKVGVPNPDYDYYDEYSPEFLFVPDTERYVMETADSYNVLYGNDEGRFFILNGSKDRVYTLCAYAGFTLKHQENYAGTPNNPYDLYWYDEFNAGGVGSFYFSLSNITAERNMLDPYCMSYMIYADGEPMIFEEAENTLTYRPAIIYSGITEPTMFIPYMFENWADIWVITDTDRRLVGIYNPDIKTIGVQGYYDYNGVRTWTDIVTYNRLTNGVTTTPGTDAGVNDIVSDNDSETVIYNLQGIRLDRQPERGAFIVNGRKIVR